MTSLSSCVDAGNIFTTLEAAESGWVYHSWSERGYI
jgi:hypothetical protein